MANGQRCFKQGEEQSLLLLNAMLLICKQVKEAFFRFFIKKSEKCGARGKSLAYLCSFYFNFFYLACSSTPTADRGHSLQTHFVIHVLMFMCYITQGRNYDQVEELSASVSSAVIQPHWYYLLCSTTIMDCMQRQSYMSSGTLLVWQVLLAEKAFLFEGRNGGMYLDQID